MQYLSSPKIPCVIGNSNSLCYFVSKKKYHDLIFIVLCIFKTSLKLSKVGINNFLFFRVPNEIDINHSDCRNFYLITMYVIMFIKRFLHSTSISTIKFRNVLFRSLTLILYKIYHYADIQNNYIMAHYFCFQSLKKYI